MLAIAREHVESGGLAAGVADTMQALATPSRVRILGRLRAGALSVNELAEAVGMEPSAVHVAHLLDEAVSHVEHLQLGLAGRTRQRDTTDVPA